MKKNKAIPFFVVLILLLTYVSPVFAAGPTGDWVSGITCQNLDSVNDAAINVGFYDDSGSEVLSYDDTIPAGGTLKYFTPSSPAGLPSVFLGSAVVSSNVPVACNVNTQTTGTGTLESPYRIGTNAGLADSETASTMFAPQVMKDLGGTWNSYVAIQNTSGSSVDVEVLYKDTTGATVTSATENVTIPAYSSHISYQNDNVNLPSGFVGSAIVSASDPVSTKLAVVVNFYNNGVDAYSSQFLSYTAFSGGAQSLYVPRLVRRFYGYNGGLTIQNIGSISTAVQVDFKFGGSDYSYTSGTIVQGASIVLYLPNLTELNPVDALSMTVRVGSAKVTALESGAEIVAIINEDNRGNPDDNNGSPVPLERIGQGSTYNAVADGMQSTDLFFVQLTRKAGGIFSGGFQVSNTTGIEASCDATFVSDADAGFSFTIPANDTKSYYGPNIVNLDDGYNAGVYVSCDQAVVGIGNLAVEAGSGKYGDSFTQSNMLNQ